MKLILSSDWNLYVCVCALQRNTEIEIRKFTFGIDFKKHPFAINLGWTFCATKKKNQKLQHLSSLFSFSCSLPKNSVKCRIYKLNWKSSGNLRRKQRPVQRQKRQWKRSIGHKAIYHIIMIRLFNPSNSSMENIISNVPIAVIMAVMAAAAAVVAAAAAVATEKQNIQMANLLTKKYKMQIKKVNFDFNTLWKISW